MRLYRTTPSTGPNNAEGALFKCSPWRHVIFGPFFTVLGAVVAWQGTLSASVVAQILGPLIAFAGLGVLVLGLREILSRRRTSRASGH